MRKYIFRFTALIAFAFLFTIPEKSLCQQAVIAKDPQRIDKVVKLGGWNIPEFAANQSTSKSDIVVDNRTVTLRGYRLKDGAYGTLDNYSLDPNNVLLLRSRSVELENIASYSADNKIFAYQVVCVPFGVADDGSKMLAGSMIRVFYFDEDGDGLFETRYVNSEFPNFIPNWISNKK